ncbi:efflux RND transporter permease subunit [Piscinibacter sp.]|uniref:efflux RND transporter permease subunit n=1 Tax=Piscinibacter sp. TaxID=1903157 RepID=UPI002CD8B4E8|nr:MMPL family transporter [Albitalea sp.]HUG20937.1 MMPL family transporter [Albitalea sp.]
MNTTDRSTRIERFFERHLFAHRIAVLAIFALVSIALGWQAAQLRPDASLAKMVPTFHPYIANYLKYENELRPLGNVVRIAVETTDGDIYTKHYLETLKKITDEVFYIRGIDRGNLKSLWTPNMDWVEVTEEGFQSGPVIPKDFDGSTASLEQVRTNVMRSGAVGSMVANDFKSAVVLAPLFERDPDTGEKLDYGQLSQQLEELVRTKYEGDRIKVHITGGAKIVGDLIAGAGSIAMFFGITFLMTAALLYAYSRCWRSTLVTLLCCSLAVVWQLGIVQLLGFGLDPYAILVPFLTFAIGVSHAVQNINTMATERWRGLSNLDAAKVTFRALFVAGSIALLCDAVGFSTLLVIRIGAIQELAISASVGVAVIIFTKMFLLPVLMSYAGVSQACLRHQERKAHSRHRAAHALSRFAEPGRAKVAVLAACALLAAGLVIARDLKIGDLDPGAPELRRESRYNQDVAYMTTHYATSADVFVVMVTTPVGECGAYPVAAVVDRFQWEMENVPGVESTLSLFTGMKAMIAATYSGDLKWYAITRDRYISNSVYKALPGVLHNTDCSMLPVLLFLKDHKADTLAGVVAAAEAFAARHNDEHATFVLAAGNSGVEAATNIVVKQSERLMLLLVYGIVSLLVWWEFKSWRIALCIMIPLYITSVLCEALMTLLGLGVKVGTLPVIALGVGIGVDYGIYIYNRLEHFLRQGLSLKDAYFHTLTSTGVAVALTGVTLALGVSTWVFSAIKFHADMGLLLAFMFLWNMVGAIVMIPALAALIVRPQPQPNPSRKEAFA